MNSTANTKSPSSDRVHQYERIFAAPRSLVWQAWTQPEHLVHWWGPKGWTLPVCNLDLRPGGVWHYCMRGPNGEESWGRSIYHEVVEPERLVWTDAFSDAEGTVNEEMPEMEVTVTFEDLGDRTRVIGRTEFATAEALQAVLEMGMEEGMNQTLDRLDEHLAQQTA